MSGPDGMRPVPGEPPTETNMKMILKTAIDIIVFVVIVVAPAIPYLKQYSIVRSTKDVGAFSIYVCAIVLYGQAFRILFW